VGAFVAHAHGRPWKDYQRLTADLLGERLPNGAYRWPVAVVLWPRQAGKTTWVFDLAMGRCIEQPDYRAAYTAQTGHVTTERMSERMAELSGTALAKAVTRRRSQGTERMTFGGGSYLKAFPPKDGALRGSALDLVIVDEAQEIDETLGRALDQTIVPTFQTRRRRQLILVGTAGTTKSDYLRRYLDLARVNAPGVALVEYGFGPDDDPTDPEVWRRCHPGLANGLADEDGLRTALSVMGLSGFAREYGNVWQVTSDAVIPHGIWTAAAAPLAQPVGTYVPVVAVDVSVDRTRTTIAACWPSTDGGLPVVEIIACKPGVSWAAPELKAIRDADRPAAVVATADGPVATVVDAATRLGVAVTTVLPREYGAACASFYDAILDRRVLHRAEPDLDLAVAGAARRPLGDGWVWGRRTSAAEISPLVAVTLASWGHEHRPPPAQPPRVITVDEDPPDPR
jgi:hypothetical protein